MCDLGLLWRCDAATTATAAISHPACTPSCLLLAGLKKQLGDDDKHLRRSARRTDAAA